MRLLTATAMALALVAPCAAQAATTITFDDGDLSGGGVFSIQQGTSLDSVAGYGNVLKVPVLLEESEVWHFAAIFLDQAGAAWSGGTVVITSFDIKAFKDTNLRLIAATDGVNALYTQALEAGVWTTVTKRFSKGLGSNGDIRADHGFYLDNIVWEYADNPNPGYEPGGPGGGVSGVPEPATWAMMITGFGLAGATIRRRRLPLAA